jgi:uncharacterized protein YegL
MSSPGYGAADGPWTLLTLVVDRSASMGVIRAEIERGITALVHQQSRGGDACFVTLTQFDDEFEVVADGVPAAEMLAYRLRPRGNTALLDAIGNTIAMVQRRMQQMRHEDRPVTVIVAVITDGKENASKSWTRPQVIREIEARTAEGWQFTFLAADEDALEEGLSLGFATPSLLTWERSDKGAAGAMQSLSDSSRRLRSGLADRIEYTDAERLAAAGGSVVPLPPQRVERPYLFLDIDGVLNVLEKDIGRHAEMFDDFAEHTVPFETVSGYRRSVSVWISPSMTARVAGLAADIHWVTTWGDRVGSTIAPRCGLPRDLPVLTRDDGSEEWFIDWKFRAVRAMLEGNPRPFVWVDDDIDFLQDGALTPRAWADHFSEPNLLIAPEAGTGLLARHIDLIDEFLHQHRGEADVDAGDGT